MRFCVRCAVESACQLQLSLGAVQEGRVCINGCPGHDDAQEAQHSIGLAVACARTRLPLCSLNIRAHMCGEACRLRGVIDK